MSETRQPGWAYWSVVGLAAGILYLLSLGPACWLAYHLNASPSIWATLEIVYSPIDLLTEHMPQSVNNAIDWYVTAGCRP